MQSIGHKTLLRTASLIVLLVVLVMIAYRVRPASIGGSDFSGYWTCARLLLRGEDPYDVDNILKVQREAYPDRDYPMFAWNPPWLGVLLLPLAALPFPEATTIWMLINVSLIMISSLGIWWLFDGPYSTPRLWLALPTAFLFAQTLTTLATGQITTFMLVGVSGFLVALKLKRHTVAGMFLAFTTVKPHLVFLWLPLVFLWTLEHWYWRVWLGFGLILVSWLFILTAFLPAWPIAYTAILQDPPTNWATPTLGGLMSMAWGHSWLRFLGLSLVPAVVVLWWRTRHQRPELVTAGLLPLSLALAVFGWGYDQILLLLPIIAIVVSLVRRELSHRDNWITATALGICAVALIVQRVSFTNESLYFWVPWAVLLIGAWTAWRHRQNHSYSKDAEWNGPRDKAT